MGHCQQIPVQDCREKPRRHCVLVPSIRTKEVTMQECSVTSEPRCEPTTRTERFVVIFPAIVRSAMMYLRSGVITNRLQSPGTRMMKTARAQPPGNVFQPPDRSVIPWWSRCPGRHTRPIVQQSTWRNVPLAMVIDILVQRFYSKCMYVIYERIKLFTLLKKK